MSPAEQTIVLVPARKLHLRITDGRGVAEVEVTTEDGAQVEAFWSRSDGLHFFRDDRSLTPHKDALAAQCCALWCWDDLENQRLEAIKRTDEINAGPSRRLMNVKFAGNDWKRHGNFWVANSPNQVTGRIRAIEGEWVSIAIAHDHHTEPLDRLVLRGDLIEVVAFKSGFETEPSVNIIIEHEPSEGPA